MTGEQLYNEFKQHRIVASLPGTLYSRWDTLTHADRTAWAALAKKVVMVDRMGDLLSKIGAISGELGIAKAGVDEALQTINAIERSLEG